jgi:hypothetical protein
MLEGKTPLGFGVALPSDTTDYYLVVRGYIEAEA